MKIQTKNMFGDNAVIRLKDEGWLVKQRIAGKTVAKTLKFLENKVLENTALSMLELNKLAEDIIYSENCTPTFKGYKGFPAGVCISINKTLVHGIPTDYVLKDGDVVSFDLGATYQGAIADSALTCIFGNSKSEEHVRLVKATEECLTKAIESIAIGKRLGCIGNTISKCAKNYGFGLIYNYGGHGLDLDIPHAAPFVSNKAELDEGIRIAPGLVIAIEPLLCIGSPHTKVSDNGWDVMTENINCHFEHSLYIHENSVEVITARD